MEVLAKLIQTISAIFHLRIKVKVALSHMALIQISIETDRSKRCRKVLKGRVLKRGQTKIRGTGVMILTDKGHKDPGLGQDLEVHPEDRAIAKKEEVSATTETLVATTTTAVIADPE